MFGTRQRITAPAQDRYVRAGTMAMRFLISSDREFGDVGSHYIAGEVEVDMPAAGAAFIPYLKRHVPCIGHEVHRHLESPDLPFAAEIVFFLRRKTVGKNEIVVENEIEVVKQVHHKRRAGYGKIPNGGATLPVEVLVLCVQRDREQAAWVPLEGLLLAVSLPHRSGSMAVKDINHLFIEMFLRFQFCPRWDFAHVAVVSSARALEIDKCSQAALVIPRRNFQIAQVLDKKAAVDGNLLGLLPSVVGIDPCVAVIFHGRLASFSTIG